MFQHYYKHHENKIKEALEKQGIGTKGLSDREIAVAYANNPKAQIDAQNILEAEQQEAAFRIKEKLKVNVGNDILKFMVHYLGEKGTEDYLNLYKKYGEKEADRIIAYGDPKEPNIKPIGGPDSSRPNKLVSEHIDNFNKTPVTLTEFQKDFLLERAKEKAGPEQFTSKKEDLKTAIKVQYGIDATEEQLNTILDNKLSTNEKLKKLGLISENKIENKTVTETKDPNFLEKIYKYVFESEVPIKETKKIKEAADGNPIEDEEYISSKEINLNPILPKKLTGTPIRKVTEDPKIKQRKIEDENFTKSMGYQKINDKVYKGKSYKNLDLGSYSKMIIDMSDGITVTYQPRNAKKEERTEVNNAIAITDYEYDFDFTDNSYDIQADNQIQNLKYRWKTKDYTNQPYVQVRESLGNGKYKVKIKAVKDLTENDFKENKIYRQSYAKLSDFDISEDGKKIKLYNYKNSFVNQGIPFRNPENQEHTLRISGGKGNHSKYQNISDLNQFGPYLGGTVTIISEDGKISKKVTGSIKDILETAFYIKKQTGSNEIYFLQSDAGSMNIKADANNGKITPAQLAIARNQEPQAGAAEILLNE